MSSHPAAAPIAINENSATRITLAQIISRRRSKRSTITPAGRPITSHGRKTANVVSAIRRASSVSVNARRGMATKLTPSPMLEITLAVHWRQYARESGRDAIAATVIGVHGVPALAVLTCWRSVVDTPAPYTEFEPSEARFTL